MGTNNMLELTMTARALAGTKPLSGEEMRAAERLHCDEDFALDLKLRIQRLSKLSPDALRARAKAAELPESLWGDASAIARNEVGREYLAAEAE